VDHSDNTAENTTVAPNTTAAVAPYAVRSSHSSQQQDETVRVDVPVTHNTSVDESTVSQPIAAIDVPQQIINTTPVTTPPSIAYNTNKEVTAGDESGDQTAGFENNRRGGSVKGFLRKATRFIERRTGVATTNDDDELLIGAVAIKLK
jgi:hypothetical protein